MDTLPAHLWCNVLELTPRIHFKAWSGGSHDTTQALTRYARATTPYVYPALCRRDTVEFWPGREGTHPIGCRGAGFTSMPAHADTLLMKLRQSLRPKRPVPRVNSELLFWAAAEGRVHTLQFLKEWDFSLASFFEKLSRIGQEALLCAASWGQVGALQFLMQWAIDRLDHHPAANKGVPGRVEGGLFEGRFLPNDMALSDIIENAVRHDHVPVLQHLKTWGITWDYLDCLPMGNYDSRHVGELMITQAVLFGRTAVLSFFKEWAAEASELKGSPRRGKGEVRDFMERRHRMLYHALTNNGCGPMAVITLLRQWGLTVADLRADHNRPLILTALHGHVTTFRMFRDWRDSNAGPDRLTLHDLRQKNNKVLRCAALCLNVDMLQLLKDWDGPGQGLTLQDTRCKQDRALFNAAVGGSANTCRFLKHWSETHPLTNADALACLRHAQEGGWYRRYAWQTLCEAFEGLPELDTPMQPAQ